MSRAERKNPFAPIVRHHKTVPVRPVRVPRQITRSSFSTKTVVAVPILEDQLPARIIVSEAFRSRRIPARALF